MTHRCAVTLVIPLRVLFGLANAGCTMLGAGGPVRYKTALILSAALIAIMFGFPAVVQAVFLPSLQRGAPNPIPGYERILLEGALFFMMWRWLVVPTTVLALSLVAAVTSKPLQTKHRHTGPRNMHV